MQESSDKIEVILTRERGPCEHGMPHVKSTLIFVWGKSGLGQRSSPIYAGKQ